MLTYLCRIFLLIVIMALIIGCGTLESLAGGSDKPTAEINNAKLQDLSLEKVDLILDVEIDNPYTLPLPFTNCKYTVASKGSQFLEGTANIQGLIPAQSSKVLPIPATIAFAPMLQTLKNVVPGSVVPYDIKLDLFVEAPVVGNMTIPIETSGAIPIPSVPEMQITNIQWKELSLNNASANLNLQVKNTNQFPIDLNELKYQLHLGDIPVSQNSITQAQKFEENVPNTLQIPISLSPIQMGLASFQLLQGKGSSYRFEGGMKVDSPFGPIDIPFSKNGETQFQK